MRAAAYGGPPRPRPVNLWKGFALPEPEHEVRGSAWAQDKRARPVGRRKSDTKRARREHAAWVGLATAIAAVVQVVLDRGVGC